MADPVVQNLPATPDSLGPKTAAESFPVVLPDGFVIPVDTTGLATDAKQDVIIAAIDGVEASLASIAAEDFATEATLEKIRSWPYANYDYVGDVWTPGTFTEVFTYKTGGSGGSTVGTITLVFTDDSREQLASASYNPAKVV